MTKTNNQIRLARTFYQKGFATVDEIKSWGAKNPSSLVYHVRANFGLMSNYEVIDGERLYELVNCSMNQKKLKELFETKNPEPKKTFFQKIKNFFR